MALGATRADTVRLVLREVAVMCGAGLLLGLLAVWPAAKGVKSMLFGVSALDPWTLLVVGLVVGATALVAAAVPARRAAGVDPLIALRTE